MLFLFIEDDLDSAEAFAALANSLGHRSHLAHEGGVGLRLAAATRYDAIFMDIGLPDIDGLTLCKYIRSAGNSTHACIVAVTGKTHLEEEQMGDFDGYVTKPMTELGMTRIIQAC
ncbi:response regulator [Caballeronia sp. LZ043]|uniref:response regulator transcription factor n=1 Tax=Caballeronia sp. LZ043 TaxID=3038569 RepID=UPI00285B201F|nr:response regulator [Caballeronia sp. LZ043]MDR5822664.1 response regulator [Caballeronia sp. LZ043]